MRAYIFALIGFLAGFIARLAINVSGLKVPPWRCYPDVAGVVWAVLISGLVAPPVVALLRVDERVRLTLLGVLLAIGAACMASWTETIPCSPL